VAKSILLVDDDPEIRDSVEEVLRGEGYAVLSVGNGRDALRHLEESEPPDLIILDLMMPVMDGWQFRIAQRRAAPELASTPVVVISADDSPMAAAIDAAVFLRKPFPIDALTSSVRRVLADVDRARERDIAARFAHADRMASLGTLAAGIAHEISNPLAYVLGNLRLLQGQLAAVYDDCRRAPEEWPERAANLTRLVDVDSMVADSIDGANRIAKIVRGVRTFSVCGDEERVPLDLRPLLDACLVLTERELRGRAELVREFGDVPLVQANDAQLKQVFVNLLMNAAQAIPDRRDQSRLDRIVVRTATAASGDAVVEISDTGVGIPPAIRGRIFDPFFTTKPVGSGVGLGLSICHSVVTGSGGEIDFESESGRGTTFRVTLPPT
jgi:signal transduction histidine kinase